MSSPTPIRMIIVDDQLLMRDGIATLLSLEDGIEIVAKAANGQDAIEQALATQPDMVLMDIHMPIMNGIEATKQIRQRLPHCQVLMLTTFDDDEYIVQSLRNGASGYLLKDIPSEDLAQAVRLAHNGIFQLAPNVAGKLVGSLFQPPQSAPPPPTEAIPVTPREIEVLRLLAAGATNKEIAQALVVSEGTVKKHVSNILQTLELRDRTQAAIYAVKRGLA